MLEKSQKQVLDAMYESASVLAENSDGMFHAYEPNPDRFKYHSILPLKHNYRVEGAPIPNIDDSDSIASIVDSRYEKLPEAIDLHEQNTGAITQISNVLRSGQSVALGLEHGELIDVAMAEVGVSNALRRRGIEHRSALVVSKAIDFMGVNIEYLGIPPDYVKTYLAGIGIEVNDDDTVPVRDFLSIAAHAIYMTIPSTKTFADIRAIQEVAIKTFNARSTEALSKEIDSSDPFPVLLGVAVPGTTVKILDTDQIESDDDDERPIEVIGQISPGITKFMSGALTYATAIRLDETPPLVQIHKDFLCVKDKGDIDSLAERLVEVASELEPDKRFVYDGSGDLRVIRK